MGKRKGKKYRRYDATTPDLPATHEVNTEKNYTVHPENIPAKKELEYELGEVIHLAPTDIQFPEVKSRKYVNKEFVEDLVTSAKKYGVRQPIKVRPVPDGLEVFEGATRLMAALVAELETVPVIIEDVTPEDAFKFSIQENVLRKDLDPISEALAYKHLNEAFKWSQKKIAKEYGKTESYVSNKLRLLSLPQKVQNLVIDFKLAESSALELLKVEDAKVQFDLATQFAEGDYNRAEIRQIIKARVSPAKVEPEITEPEAVAEPVARPATRCFGCGNMVTGDEYQHRPICNSCLTAAAQRPKDTYHNP